MFYNLLTFIDDYKKLNIKSKKAVTSFIENHLNGKLDKEHILFDDLKSVISGYLKMSDDGQILTNKKLREIKKT